MRVTVGQFQDLYKISESPVDEIEKATMMLMVLTNKTEKQIENLSVKQYNRLCKITKSILDLDLIANDKRKPQKFIRVNGTTYQLHYDVARLDGGKYVEAVTFSDDPIGNLHKIMATMSVPMEWTWKGLRAKPYEANRHEQIAEEMKDADFSTCYHAMVFFYVVLNNLMKSLLTSGNPQEADILERLQRLSVRSLGGYITAKWFLNLKESV